MDLNASIVSSFNTRVERQKAFFASSEAQVMPFYRKSLNFTPFITELLHIASPDDICNQKRCDESCV